jgi:elongation factor Tu
MDPLPPIRHFRAKLYALTHDEGGREKPFQVGYSPQLHVNGGAACHCSISKIEGCGGYDEVPQGKELNAEILFFEGRPPLEVGSDFELREGARVSARGRVSELLKDDS